MSILHELFISQDLAIPGPLSDWDDRVADWCQKYRDKFGHSQLSEIRIDSAVFQFDHRAERVILAYAVSVPQLMERDRSRIQGYPDVNLDVKEIMGGRGFIADKGHFLGHASGGILDINLFPQRRELNRGWSEQGKVFRSMERFVANNPGCFFYHRPVYDGTTSVPSYLEYGVLKDGKHWWIETFANK